MDTRESPLLTDRTSDSPSDFLEQGAVAVPAPLAPNDPPWGVLLALLCWFTSVVFLGLIPVLTAVPYMIYRASNDFPVDASMGNDPNFIFFQIVGVIPAHLLTLVVAWLIVTRVRRYPFWQTLGWYWPANFGPGKSVAVALALFAIAGLVSYYLGGPPTQLEEIINSSYRTRVVMAILAATTGPLVEEIIYRGLLFSALRRATGVVVSVMVVSIMFAGVHFIQYWSNVWVIAVICLLSVTLTVVRAYGGSLLPPFVIHLIFNGIQSVLLVFQPLFQKTEPAVPDPIPAYLITLLTKFFT